MTDAGGAGGVTGSCCDPSKVMSDLGRQLNRQLYGVLRSLQGDE
ncbi:hypothetical protein [Nonomuraea sp. NPDC049646]